MYNITMGLDEEGECILELRTETRSLARAAIQLAVENGLDCEVTEERKPRPVKFKGVE